jgi:hypothetical protein
MIIGKVSKLRLEILPKSIQLEKEKRSYKMDYNSSGLVLMMLIMIASGLFTLYVVSKLLGFLNAAPNFYTTMLQKTDQIISILIDIRNNTKTVDAHSSAEEAKE